MKRRTTKDRRSVQGSYSNTFGPTQEKEKKKSVRKLFLESRKENGWDSDSGIFQRERSGRPITNNKILWFKLKH